MACHGTASQDSKANEAKHVNFDPSFTRCYASIIWFVYHPRPSALVVFGLYSQPTSRDIRSRQDVEKGRIVDLSGAGFVASGIVGQCT